MQCVLNVHLRRISYKFAWDACIQHALNERTTASGRLRPPDQGRKLEQKVGAPPFPLLSPPSPLLFPPLSLEVGPMLRQGGLGERLSSPSGSGQSPAAKRYLVHFRLFNWPLVTILWLKKTTKNYVFYGILKWEVSPHPSFTLSFPPLLPLPPFPSFPLPSTFPLPHFPSLKSSYGVLGSAVNSPSGVWGEAPTDVEFWHNLGMRNHVWWHQIVTLSCKLFAPMPIYQVKYHKIRFCCHRTTETFLVVFQTVNMIQLSSFLQ